MTRRDAAGTGQAPGDRGRREPAFLSENPAFEHPSTRTHTMDVERINAIGTTLADLTQRTLDLRGYL
jgi:hypothetical protein